MKVTRGIPPSQLSTPCALTIGNFDGVHQGHQALLKKLTLAAKARGIPACVLTFDPHPREYFDPSNAPVRILSLRDKLEALNDCGIDHVVVEHFNAGFAKRTADEFVQEILVKALHTRYVVIGDDFCYGAKRAGNIDTLKEAGTHFGFEVESMDSVLDSSLSRISSTAIRTALQKGNLEEVHQHLGRPYSISGHVIHGRKLGRTLGFPTLNIAVSTRHHQKKPALSGVFVAQVHGLATSPLPAVASLGVRPTVEDAGRVLLEVHIFDFDASIYGKVVKIELVKKLRDEAKYPDLDTLKAAILADARDAQNYFKNRTNA